jgi:hypothetical protein
VKVDVLKQDHLRNHGFPRFVLPSVRMARKSLNINHRSRLILRKIVQTLCDAFHTNGTDFRACQ